ncbi:7257_t:CDS:1, partial [Dentiscutata heterogama]
GGYLSQCCTVIKLLPKLPLVQPPDSSIHVTDENLAKKLGKKIEALELFLRDYVVEAQLLDKIYKNIENIKDR